MSSPMNASSFRWALRSYAGTAAVARVFICACKTSRNGSALSGGEGKDGTHDRPTKSIHHPFEIKMIAGPVAERGTDVGGDGGRVGEQDGEEV